MQTVQVCLALLFALATPSSPAQKTAVANAAKAAAEAQKEDFTPAERQKWLTAIRSAMVLAPDEPSVLNNACRVALSVDDDPLLQKCSHQLAKVAASDPETHLFLAIAAARSGSASSARQHLAQARSLGLDPALADRVSQAIDRSEPATKKWGAPALLALLGWGAAFLFLFLLGTFLSAITMRTAVRMARAPAGASSGVSGFLRATYGTVLWLCCIYYYVSIPVVLVGVLALGGGVIYLFHAMGRIPLKLVLLLILLVAVTAWAVLKGLWVSMVRSADAEDPGHRLDTSHHPLFKQALERVAKRIGTRPVDAVFLTPGTEIAVFERGGMLKQLTGRTERCLILGIGVLEGMAQGELKAILAHEYGHLVNRDTAGGGLALAVRRSLWQMAKTLAEGGAATWYSPAWWFVNGFHRAFLRISQGASRLQEILADRWAALAYGGRNFARGLEHAIRCSIRFDTNTQNVLKEVIEGARPLANLYRYQPATQIDEKAVDDALKEAINAEPSPYDSHPSPRDRIAWVGPLVATSSTELSDRDPAWDLFADREAVERLMTDQIRQAVAANHGVEIATEAEAEAGRPAGG